MLKTYLETMEINYYFYTDSNINLKIIKFVLFHEITNFEKE